MRIALVHDHYDAAHLVAVKSAMQALGAPTIHAVWMECWGVWAALEGCHRLRAAYDLGLVPQIEAVAYCETTTLADLGLDGDYTVADIADDAYRATILAFFED